MKRILLGWAFLSTIALGAQRPAPGKPEQYPGQGNHAQPPEGWMCEPKTKRPAPPPDRACLCHMQCQKDANGVEFWQPDPQCSSWCWEKQCACPRMHCDEGS